MTVDELQVLITANANQLRKELASVKSELTGIAGTAAKQTSAFKGSFLKAATGASALGNIIANVATSAFRALSSSIGGAVSRLDTLNNYPKVMSNLGIDAQSSQASIQRLNDALNGLPTTLDAAAMSVQRLTSANGNIGASTEMFLALNNAILAGGATMDIQNSALEQLSQSYAKGKPDMMEWRTAMTAMPAQLKQVANAMGYVSADALGEALRTGEINMNDFMKKLVEMNKQGANGFQSLEEQARNATGGVGTSIVNVQTAFTRGLANIMNAIGQANIAAFFNGIASAINAVVPYVVAFVKVIVTAVAWVRTLFGGGKAAADGMTASSNNAAVAVGGVGAAAAGAASDIDSATGSAKKLKKELNGLASFDEMNVLKDASADNSGGSGGGGGGAGGADLSGIGDLDMGGLTDGLSKADAIAQSMLGFFKQIGEVAKTVWDSAPVQAFVGAVGTYIGFLVGFWTQVGVAIWDNLVGTWQRIAPNVMTGMNNVVTLWTLFWLQVQETFNTWGQPFIESVVTLFDAVWRDAIDPALQIAAQIWADFTGILLDTWNKHGASILNGIGEFVTKTVQLFQSIWDNVLAPIIKPFLEELGKLWDNHIKGMVDQIVNFVAKLIDAALQIYNKFIQPIAKFLLEILRPAFVTIGSVIAGVFGTVIGTISSVVGSIFGVLGGLIDFLTGVFTGNWRKAWDGVKSIFSNIVNGLGAIFKAPLNLIIDLINGMIAGINSIKIPDWVPGIGGKNLNIPKIPKLAQGGIVSKATLAVVGEAGTEAVMPLERNTGWIDLLASKLNASAGSGGSIALTVKLGEDTIATKVIDLINDQSYMKNAGAITL